MLFAHFVSAFSVTPYDYTLCISRVFICILLSSFPLSPFHIVLPPPSLCRNHRGSCLFTLFLGIKAVAITRCQLYALPTPPPPHSLFCVFLSPDTVCGLPLPSLGDLHGERPMAEQGSPVWDKRAEVAHMELLSGVGDREWAEVPAVLICTVAETPLPNKTSVSA